MYTQQSVMTATQNDGSLPCSWSKTMRLRQEKIARRLAENGSRASEIDLDAIKARRARLRALTKNMKRPLTETQQLSAPSSAYSRANVRLAPIGSRLPNQLDRKLREDSLLQKRKLPSMFPRDSNETDLWIFSRRGTYDNPVPLMRKTLGKLTLVPNGKTPVSVAEFPPSVPNGLRMSFSQNKDGPNGGVDLQFKLKEDKLADEKHEGDSDVFPKETEERIQEITEKLKSTNGEYCSEGISDLKERLSQEGHRLFDSYLKEGTVPLLIDCLSCNELKVQLEAAALLENLFAKQPEYADAIFEAGVIPKLIALLSSPEERVVLQAIEALGTLAEESLFVCQSVVDEGAVKALYEVAERNPTVNCVRKLSKTFRIMNEHKSLSPCHEDMVLLVKAAKVFLHHPDQEVFLNGCWSFAGITDSDRNKIDEVLKSGVIPYIIEGYLNSDIESKITPAVKTVGNIMAETDEQTETVVAAGVVPVLVKQLDHKSMKVRKECAWALSNIMCGTYSQIQTVIDSNTLQRLSVTINEDEAPVKREAIWCVSNLLEIGSADQIRDAINSDLLRMFSRNIPKYAYTTDPFDKPMLYHLLNGVRNMIKFCSDEIATSIILEEISLEDIERLTHNEDNDINEQAKLLYYFLTNDENAVAEENQAEMGEEQHYEEQQKQEQDQSTENQNQETEQDCQMENEAQKEENKIEFNNYEENSEQEQNYKEHNEEQQTQEKNQNKENQNQKNENDGSMENEVQKEEKEIELNNNEESTKHETEITQDIEEDKKEEKVADEEEEGEKSNKVAQRGEVNDEETSFIDELLNQTIDEEEKLNQSQHEEKRKESYQKEDIITEENEDCEEIKDIEIQEIQLIKELEGKSYE